MSIEERDVEEQFFKSIQFNYGKPTTKETIMNFANEIRTDQRNKDAEKCDSIEIDFETFGETYGHDAEPSEIMKWLIKLAILEENE